MSLYIDFEICQGCVYAVFHDCGNCIKTCKMHAYGKINHLSGICPEYVDDLSLGRCPDCSGSLVYEPISDHTLVVTCLSCKYRHGPYCGQLVACEYEWRRKDDIAVNIPHGEDLNNG